jgi:hypothetical protein
MISGLCRKASDDEKLLMLLNKVPTPNITVLYIIPRCGVRMLFHRIGERFVVFYLLITMYFL